MRRFFVLFAILAFGLSSACKGSETGDRRISVTMEDGRLVFSDSIRFETDSDELAAGSTEVLDAIAAFLSSHSGIAAIRIEGHTDQHGAEDHNLDLSRRRAQTVATYLGAHGVTQTMTTEGFGTSRPLCTESTEDCDARNRRVDFFIVSE